MEQTDVIGLLDGLYSMIAEAWGVPLGNDKCIIEREKALDIINEIKAAMPSSLAEAKRLVAARDEFIGNAKKEAEALRKSSEEKAKAMVEEQEVIRVARRKSAEMISSAVASSLMARAASAMRSDALGPMMWTPSTSPKGSPRITLIRPSPPFRMRALPLAISGNLPTL